MNLSTKFYLILLVVFFVGLFCFMYFFTYELYREYRVVKNDIENLVKSQKSETELPFIAIPIQPPQNEVVILQPKEIELPKVKEVVLPNQATLKQNIAVIKGATSAFISNFSGAIR